MKLKTAKLIAAGFLLVIASAVGGVYYYLTMPSDTPEAAVKKYVFLQGSPIEAFNLTIERTGVVDKSYGQLFEVRGFYDNETGQVEIPFFYLKKSAKGWYVNSAGTGP